jgi:CRP/FNR family transcriptional regulator
MTSFREKPQLADRGADLTAGATSPASSALPRVRMDLARRKQLRLSTEASTSLYVVDSGCLTMDVVLSSERRQVLLILYPGEIVSREILPPLEQVVLTAMLPSVVSRLQAPTAADARAAEGYPPGYLSTIARLSARSSLHALMIGRLTGEERLTSLLIEMALFLGSRTAGGYILELPLTREDMADYLALNPDTLSRMLSRLKSRDLISLPTRNRVIIKDFAALAATTPLADAFRSLHAQAVVGKA